MTASTSSAQAPETSPSPGSAAANAGPSGFAALMASSFGLWQQALTAQMSAVLHAQQRQVTLLKRLSVPLAAQAETLDPQSPTPMQDWAAQHNASGPQLAQALWGEVRGQAQHVQALTQSQALRAQAQVGKQLQHLQDLSSTATEQASKLTAMVSPLRLPDLWTPALKSVQHLTALGHQMQQQQGARLQRQFNEVAHAVSSGLEELGKNRRRRSKGGTATSAPQGISAA